MTASKAETPAKTTTTTTTASAPGKILLAGGYLVLESPNVGLVVAVDKRFYTTVEFTGGDTSTSMGASKADNDNDNAAHIPSDTTDTLSITVKSPQFRQEWRYLYQKSLFTLTADESFNTSTNAFVEKTLRVSLLYLLSRIHTDQISTNNDHTILRATALLVTIRADNDFYSLVPHLEERGLDRSLASVQKLPPFLPATADADGKILKTGLGSSAALVTSLVAALCHAHGSTTAAAATATTTDILAKGEDDNNDDAKNNDTSTNIIHNLAQICHCHAQGKVGSGFDVSSACHGSHVYQRFPASILASLLTRLDANDMHSDSDNKTDNKNSDSNDSSQSSAVRNLLRETVESRTWTGGIAAPLALPDVLQVMLADVSGGSESPSMARTVLAWRKQELRSSAAQSAAATAVPHWDDLVEINSSIVQLLQQVRDVSVSDQEKQTLATSTADSWEADTDADTSNGSSVGPLLFRLHQAFQESRRHLKAMGDAASVPIEPDQQSSLADATLALPGVVAALVPGAGGYDALACVYVNDDVVRQGIAKLWAEWEPVKVCPLSIQGANYGQGIRFEP
jgi:phosphomevalonate kinase